MLASAAISLVVVALIKIERDDDDDVGTKVDRYQGYYYAVRANRHPEHPVTSPPGEDFLFSIGLYITYRLFLLLFLIYIVKFFGKLNCKVKVSQGRPAGLLSLHSHPVAF